MESRGKRIVGPQIYERDSACVRGEPASEWRSPELAFGAEVTCESDRETGGGGWRQNDEKGMRSNWGDPRGG